jgi:hypothetical protein
MSGEMTLERAREVLTGTSLYSIAASGEYHKFVEFERAISTILSALDSEWVPVSERLPDEAVLVLCCGVDCASDIFTGYWADRRDDGTPIWEIHDGRIVSMEVTHWRPLPSARGRNFAR